MAKPSENSEPLLGSHVSSGGGFVRALERAESINCLAMQVFVKGNTRWEWPALKPDDVREYRRLLPRSSVRSVVAHAIYLVNLCATNPVFLQKSLADIAEELERCDALGIPGLVMHPGAHCGAGLEAGIEQVAAGLNAIFAQSPRGRCRVLLETTAGQGSALGGRFEHIAEIIARIKRKRRIGVCLDTCHVFTAGYDIRDATAYAAAWSEFDRVIGREHLFAIHLNDSKKPLGSHLDRHEHIGKGLIGLEAFRLLMNDMTLRHLTWRFLGLLELAPAFGLQAEHGQKAQASLRSPRSIRIAWRDGR
jgi:deoxyribonuclease IV